MSTIFFPCMIFFQYLVNMSFEILTLRSLFLQSECMGWNALGACTNSLLLIKWQATPSSWFYSVIIVHECVWDVTYNKPIKVSSAIAFKSQVCSHLDRLQLKWKISQMGKGICSLTWSLDGKITNSVSVKLAKILPSDPRGLSQIVINFKHQCKVLNLNTCILFNDEDKNHSLFLNIQSDKGVNPRL